MTDEREEEMDESVREVMDQLKILSVPVNAESTVWALSAMYEKNCLCETCERTILNLETSLLSMDLDDQWKQLTFDAIARRRNERAKFRKQRDAFVAKLQRLFGTRQSDAGSTG